MLAHDIATMAEKHAQELAKGQLEINKTEAQHRNIFVAVEIFVGWIWRCTCMALCVSTFIIFFLPILAWNYPSYPRLIWNL